MQAEQERKHKMQSLMLRLGVVVVAVALVAGLAFFVLTRDRDGGSFTQGPAPAAANEQGGFVLTSSTEIAEGDNLGEIDSENLPATQGEDGLPPGVGPREEGEPPHVVIYTDAGCPGCAAFESAYHGMLSQWLDAGQITLEYRSVSFVRPPYSARSANAFACMAEHGPEHYMSYLGAVTAERLNTTELSNDELAARAQNYGVDISDCLSDGEYRAFASYVNALAGEHGVGGTPTIFVNDEQVPGNEFIEQAAPMIEAAIAEYESEAGGAEEGAEGEAEGADAEGEDADAETPEGDDAEEEPAAEDSE
ncbi:DSBA oxidoreductase [Nesterenkonia flava]